MQFWKKTTPIERQARIQKALGENVNFSHDASLGYPASKLDGKVFNEEAQFLKDAPVLQTYVANPNHIGCHTFGTSEKAFRGTQEIEREVLFVKSRSFVALILVVWVGNLHKVRGICLC